MFRELAVNFPIFAETLAEADNLLRDCFAARFGEDARLSHFIFPRSCMSGQARAAALKALTRTDVTQPALGAVEAGLWKFMCSLGLEPDMLGGHSYGEFTALFAGGFYDFDVLMALSEARGRCIIDAVSEAGGEPGTMAACQTDRETVEKAISGIDGVIVANHNAPQEGVLSGSIAAVRKAVQKLSEDKVIVNEIPVAAAFHSPFVAPAQPVLA
ncbi:MAG: acyltransferase domain-containing protein, partial [Proteobacteria bacterium]|nr:acyltransferase domain-containing protein [Pseudomonadota bacterium]